MALPGSGAISLNNVNAELGLSGTATISLNDAAVRTLFAINSGAISMSDGHGKSNLSAYLTAQNCTSYFYQGPSHCYYILASDGVCSINDSETYYDNNYHAVSGQWKLVGAAGDFEASATLTSGLFNTSEGSLPGDGTWYNLGTTRAWYVSDLSEGVQAETADATFKIRMAASPFTEFASVTITFSAFNDIG